MKIAMLLTMILLCACEAKKSTGTFGRAVPKATTSEIAVLNREDVNKAAENKSDCEAIAPDFDLASTGATPVTIGELLTTQRRYANLVSSTTILSDANNRVLLRESRRDDDYSQSCANLQGQVDFEIIYSAPVHFSLTNGEFGKGRNAKAIGVRYFLRYASLVENRARATFMKNVRIKGTVLNLADSLEDMRGAEVRFFTLANGQIEIRTRKIHRGVTVTFITRYEIKKN